MRTARKVDTRASPTKALLDPLPRTALPAGCTAPMVATLGSMPSALAEFGYEVKWDGYRALARWDGRSFTLCSRNGKDLLPQFGELLPLQKALRKPVLLDGEIVAMDQSGRPSFSALQTRMPRFKGVPRGRKWDPLHEHLQFMIFDVLHYDGRSTCELTYADRRTVLESMSLSGGCWQVPPVHPDGPEQLALMQKSHQEGVIAKRLTSRYHIGRRSPDWIKIKINQVEEFIVVGYWSSGKHGLSSLLLGYYPTATDAHDREAAFAFLGTADSGESRAWLNRAIAGKMAKHVRTGPHRKQMEALRWNRNKNVAHRMRHNKRTAPVIRWDDILLLIRTATEITKTLDRIYTGAQYSFPDPEAKDSDTFKDMNRLILGVDPEDQRTAEFVD